MLIWDDMTGEDVPGGVKAPRNVSSFLRPSSNASTSWLSIAGRSGATEDMKQFIIRLP
jgi:hypothetical protein